jgi:hypothetical protein
MDVDSNHVREHWMLRFGPVLLHVLFVMRQELFHSLWMVAPAMA